MNRALSFLLVVSAVFSSPSALNAQIIVNDPPPNDNGELILDFGCLAAFNGVSYSDFVEIEYPADTPFEPGISVNICIESDVSCSGDPIFSLANGCQSPILAPSPDVLGNAVVLPIEVLFEPATGDAGDFTATVSIEVPSTSQQFDVFLIGTAGESTEVCAITDILEFFDESSSGVNPSLVGIGNSESARHRRLDAMGRRLETIDFLISRGNFNAARAVTQTAIRRCDDLPAPNDFVEDVDESGILGCLNKCCLICSMSWVNDVGFSFAN